MCTPHRKYPRAKFHDYNGGMYFVTVCTRDKQSYFGQIRNDEMQLSPLGVMLEDNLSNLSRHFPDVEVPLSVVMPNHFHAIIVIKEGHAVSHENMGRLNLSARLAVATGRDPTLATHYNSRLATVVGSVKSHITRCARQNAFVFGWQPRYHDHIIRNERDLNNIADYVENNVARWASDCFYQERQ
ncbi:MAG: transposase [Muribaculaceae bacterium]